MSAKRNWTLIAQRLEGEKLLTLTQAAKLVPTGRGHISSQALFRWVIHGKRGVYLDACKPGSAWLTSEAALLRFAVEVGRMEV